MIERDGLTRDADLVFTQQLQQMLGIDKFNRQGICSQGSFFAFARKAAQGDQGAAQTVMAGNGFTELV